ncbi:hypothetical protein SLEP1_g51218 [Rubroshorea leprosula]|uniref:U-box domain-containing protein n=1 Tax=Rubroshorea leprosula TaxID=152421 RepID=A0AAV5M4L9_9ROSI|nr:hypothetical protein SLEP1_g51218 [Rubroshorea leprosula]
MVLPSRNCILNTQSSSSPPPPLPFSAKHDELVSLLNTVESSPFKFTTLKKLRSIVEIRDETKSDFIRFNGIEILAQIIVQILIDVLDFVVFQAVHEINGNYPSKRKRRSEAPCVNDFQENGKDYLQLQLEFLASRLRHRFFKSLLEFVSDEICSKASSCALEFLIEILETSKKSRFKAIESDVVCVLIELLPDLNRSKSEKILFLIKLLCDFIQKAGYCHVINWVRCIVQVSL